MADKYFLDLEGTKTLIKKIVELYKDAVIIGTDTAETEYNEVDDFYEKCISIQTPISKLKDGQIIAITWDSSADNPKIVAFKIKDSNNETISLPIVYHGSIEKSSNEIAMGKTGITTYYMYASGTWTDSRINKTYNHSLIWMGQDYDKDTKYNFNTFEVEFTYDQTNQYITSAQSWISIIRAIEDGRNVVGKYTYNGTPIRLQLTVFDVPSDTGAAPGDHIGLGTIAFTASVGNKTISISRTYDNPDAISEDVCANNDPSPRIWVLTEVSNNELIAGNGVAIDSNVVRTTGIPFGQCDSTSTATAFTATVPGIYKLEDGVCCMIKNGVVTSASGCTLNINGLGAKPCYNSMHAATPLTSQFNVEYTALFIYDSTRGDNGGWLYYYGYYVDTNNIGYRLRGNEGELPVSDTARYYKLYFTSADNTKWVPSTVDSTNSTTSIKAVNQRPINPFGKIIYNASTINYTEGTILDTSNSWDQFNLNLGYSFNRTGRTLSLTKNKPVYIKCTPQTDGSAIIDADDPYTQTLPIAPDGKIYIYLGIAFSVAQIELLIDHPIYYHNGSGIKLWTGEVVPHELVVHFSSDVSMENWSCDTSISDIYNFYTQNKLRGHIPRIIGIANGDDTEIIFNLSNVMPELVSFSTTIFYGPGLMILTGMVNNSNDEWTSYNFNLSNTPS